MQSRGATTQARSGQQLLVGPWTHGLPRANMAGEADFGYRSTPLSIDQDRLVLNFFDRWLKDIHRGDVPARVRLFVMGPNRWRDENEWPLKRADWQPFYLHSRGCANSASGDGALSTQSPGDEPGDSYEYNPLDPTPTRGGGLCCYPAVVPGGAFDQRAIENRADVLVYSTLPLTEEVEVTGPIRLTLYASSSAPDSDFTAKLVDVDPDGHARNLTDGIIRARYRESPSDAAQARCTSTRSRWVRRATSLRRAIVSAWRSRRATFPASTAIPTPDTTCLPTPKHVPRCKP